MSSACCWLMWMEVSRLKVYLCSVKCGGMMSSDGTFLQYVCDQSSDYLNFCYFPNFCKV